ncbi:potassium transporter Kef [Marinomonas agarivorans]|nr:potassium transporter Kef [Marinomonas agarivorans]
MDFIWILVAFLCGSVIKFMGLPPLIGFLIAGFTLNALGFQSSDTLTMLADLGITLMLFTIGLKLHFQDLFKKEIWGGTLSHMGIWTLLATGGCLFITSLSLPYFTELSWQAAALIGFAFSFSSTVCAMKLLEENGELKTRHGQISLAVLVMQDVVAVVFLVFATGLTPSLWALALLGLLFCRPILGFILQKAGHGEMLPLTGFLLALGGYELFYLVGVKGDLGALVFGILLSNHVKAAELTKSLISFKDLFLVGFFLSIGLTALPTLETLGLSLVISLALLVKFVGFFAVFTLFHLRARTAFLAALALSNYSEFGLIVAHLSVKNDWLDKEILVVLALAVSISFVVTSLLYRYAHQLYNHYKGVIRRFEKRQPLVEDLFIQPKQGQILVVGLGRVGRGAFDALHHVLPNEVIGMDADCNRINKLNTEGKNVFFGDGEDADLWEKLDTKSIKLVLLALPSIEDIINIVQQLRASGYSEQIAAIARYQDERERLVEAGINNVFNFYTEAGMGFAEESLTLISKKQLLQQT